MSSHSAVLFFSNNYAIWTNKLLQKHQLDCRIIPVPRHLSSDCGYCVRIDTALRDQVVSLIESKQIEYDRVATLS
ncbi:DUF3343 domain-containing protein [Paraferrimonas sedimenticola]|uniref:Putative Se/S carrier protein-like domain-containing protein n=1 Tax=Paraferrimonas sedimenticola TaxID=375674 RepID=A0AA37RX67_9GAMM|nr:DUF3343 domain-containing protein [Paraferrimonas sedimenticola]GLP97325.1 hypothetical protein GCM10007895_26320 [Paraferrimonas sedimenticola]